MAPIEQSISQRLRQLFTTTIVPSMVAAVAGGSGGAGGGGAGGAAGSLAQPQQVFQDLKKYSGLLGMPIIASTLANEKDALAKQVDKHLVRGLGGGRGGIDKPLFVRANIVVSLT